MVSRDFIFTFFYTFLTEDKILLSIRSWFKDIKEQSRFKEQETKFNLRLISSLQKISKFLSSLTIWVCIRCWGEIFLYIFTNEGLLIEMGQSWQKNWWRDPLTSTILYETTEAWRNDEMFTCQLSFRKAQNIIIPHFKNIFFPSRDSI